MRPYDLGNPELDERVRRIVADAGAGSNNDLIGEIITTALKLQRDRPSRGDLKLINTALKEMRFSMRTFARHLEPKVTLFGSARLAADDPNSKMAEEFARFMVERGWGVITGAGPGIMEAGNRGAGLGASYGVNIRLPFEAEANMHVAPERNVNFKYFFTRKLAFVKESHAFALFPGGFGTLDETFELLTLIQTGKSDMHPIVLLEAPGTGYWAPLISFVEEVLVGKGLISREDLKLFFLAEDAKGAAEHLCHFYANYHSQRYVDGRLILRLQRSPQPEALAAFNQEFSDLLVTGQIEMVGPSPAEVADGDVPELARLSMAFDRRSYGRLRLLIDRLNDLVATPERVHPPSPFDEEQAERPW
jgi:uncharacterized protein (TIGR00730 family)